MGAIKEYTIYLALTLGQLILAFPSINIHGRADGFREVGNFVRKIFSKRLCFLPGKELSKLKTLDQLTAVIKFGLHMYNSSSITAQEQLPFLFSSLSIHL